MTIIRTKTIPTRKEMKVSLPLNQAQATKPARGIPAKSKPQIKTIILSWRVLPCIQANRTAVMPKEGKTNKKGKTGNQKSKEIVARRTI